MIKLSIEKLYHFNCEKFKKWWTIGDWEIKEKLICPHCGVEDIIRQIYPPKDCF